MAEGEQRDWRLGRVGAGPLPTLLSGAILASSNPDESYIQVTWPRTHIFVQLGLKDSSAQKVQTIRI